LVKVPDRVALWRLRQSIRYAKVRRRKKLDVEEARALVLICYLAKQHQELIRRALPSWNKWRKTSTNPIKPLYVEIISMLSVIPTKAHGYDDNASTEY